MVKKQGTDLAQNNDSTLAQYPVLNSEESQDALEVIQENLGTSGVKVSDLLKVTVPPGGGKAFTIDDGEGTQCIPTLTGIIILAPEQNAYWNKPIEEAPNDPPICFSADGINGLGDPFETGVVENHVCATCAHKGWGTDIKGGKGKACRDLRPLYLLQVGEYLPIIVQTSRTSLRRLSAYFSTLARKGIPYYAAVTEIGLTTEQKQGTPVYSVLTFACKEIVPRQLRPGLKEYQSALRFHAAKPPTAGDVATDRGEAPAGSNQAEPDYDPFADEGGPAEPTN